MTDGREVEVCRVANIQVTEFESGQYLKFAVQVDRGVSVFRGKWFSSNYDQRCPPSPQYVE